MSPSAPSNNSTNRVATSSASARNPELNAGWPQHVWSSGYSTRIPCASRTDTTASPTSGANWSTKQVPNRLTAFDDDASGVSISVLCKQAMITNGCIAISTLNSRLTMKVRASNPDSSRCYSCPVLARPLCRRPLKM